MLRRAVHKKETYDCVVAYVSDWGHPVVVVTNDQDPMYDLLCCRVPNNWEWVYRKGA